MLLKKITCSILSLIACFNAFGNFAKAADNNDSIDNNKTSNVTAAESKMAKKIIDVPYINQDDIVAGCEAVSSTMLLKYYGYEINEKDFTDNYLIKKDWHIEDDIIYGPDPDAAFPGDPYISCGLNCGFGAYAPSTAKSINKVLDGTKHKAVWQKGSDLKEITENYTDKNIPVLIWATMNMSEPEKTTTWTIDYVDENSNLKTGDKFTWTAGEHCLVLVGYDDDNYWFNDPRNNKGLTAYEKSLVKSRYDALGKQCVHIDTLKNPQDRQKNTENQE